jgi:LCP family protein required for cell wall assembly
MLHKIAKQVILLICVMATVGLLSGCTGTMFLSGADGPTALFTAGKLDSDSTLSKAANWLDNAFSKFANLAKNETEEESTTALVIPDQYQVLLIGSDRRDNFWNGNLESNFQISIDNYIATDFVSMADIIDLFGGVDLEITDAEIPVINGCINEMANLRGIDASAYQLTTAGYQHLNGIQAVGYMRDRYVGKSDFQRTERQRMVLQKLLEKLKNMSMIDLLKLSSSTAGLSIQQDFSAEQIAGLAALAIECKNYTVVMDRIPYDGLYTSNGENLDPVWAETIDRLHATIY